MGEYVMPALPEGFQVVSGGAPALPEGFQVVEQPQVVEQAEPTVQEFGTPNIEQVIAGIPDLDYEAPAPKESSVGEELLGAGEAALTMGTGATTGMAGMVGGTLKQLAEEILSGNYGSQEAAKRVQDEAERVMGMFTYEPRTEEGQDIVRGIGEATAPLQAVAGLTAPMQTMAQGARAAKPKLLAEQSKQVVTKKPVSNKPKSIGAVQIPPEQLRAQKAGELPVPIKLTKGQKTRDFEQQRFERETAKLPEGEGIRDRFSQQNQQLQQNLDAFIDETGATLTEKYEIGEAVSSALRKRAAKDKTRIRTLYREAEKKGHLKDKVTLDGLANHLNESRPESAVANVLKVIEDKSIQLGAVIKNDDGKLITQPVDLKTAELLRKTINSATNQDAPNIRQASIMKGLIDQSTEGKGGELYKKARGARDKYARDYENVSLIKNIMGTKRGTTERGVALEQILNKSIISESAPLDSLKQLRKLLQTEGGEGKQAWKELQGGTLQFIQDQALRNTSLDSHGNRVISAAGLDKVITRLDKSGKLDYIFGKKGAEQLRVINDVAKDVLVAPAGAVNNSNTATVLAGMMDIAISGTSGIPAPIATSFNALKNNIKSRKLKARINESLGKDKE